MCIIDNKAAGLFFARPRTTPAALFRMHFMSEYSFGYSVYYTPRGAFHIPRTHTAMSECIGGNGNYKEWYFYADDNTSTNLTRKITSTNGVTDYTFDSKDRIISEVYYTYTGEYTKWSTLNLMVDGTTMSKKSFTYASLETTSEGSVFFFAILVPFQ